MKKLLSILAVIVIVIVAGFYALNAYIYAEKQGDPSDIKAYRGTLSGEVVCLPHKDKTGPQTKECMIGLKTEVGEYYGLNLTLMSQQADPLNTAEHITANGLITPIEIVTTNEWQKYDVAGVFTVTDSLKKE